MFKNFRSVKLALYVLKHILNKQLTNTLSRWKACEKCEMLRKKARHAKIQSAQLSPSSNKGSCSTPLGHVKRFSSGKTEFESPVDFGTRLHGYAEEIKKKKEEVRKSAEPEYSFTPKLSNGTEKWLSSKMKKQTRICSEEVAIVSGNSVLGITNYTPNFSGLIEIKNFALKPSANGARSQKVIVPRGCEKVKGQGLGVYYKKGVENVKFF